VDTAFVRIFQPQGAFSQLMEPAGLAFTEQGYLVIADTKIGRVSVMQQAGTIITYYDYRDTNCALHIMPTDVSVCNDRIYFTDISPIRHVREERIYEMKFSDTPACRARNSLPKRRNYNYNSSEEFDSCQPMFIAAGRIACEDQLFVSAATGRGVLEFKHTKKEWVQTYLGIESPRGIAVDAGGRVFVGSETTGTVVLLV
jgi:sugar lactone lactonase YvrE